MNANGWTVETLAEHHDQMFQLYRESQHANVSAALAAADMALKKVEASTEKRFDNLAVQLEQVRSAQLMMAGSKSGSKDFWGVLIALVAIAVSLLAVYRK